MRSEKITAARGCFAFVRSSMHCRTSLAETFLPNWRVEFNAAFVIVMVFCPVARSTATASIHSPEAPERPPTTKSPATGINQVLCMIFAVARFNAVIGSVFASDRQGLRQRSDRQQDITDGDHSREAKKNGGIKVSCHLAPSYWPLMENLSTRPYCRSPVRCGRRLYCGGASARAAAPTFAKSSGLDLG